MESSTHSVCADEGPAYWFQNQLCLIKATGQQTGDAFALIHHTAPVGVAPPYHLHRNEDESFYILEGQIDFFSGGRRFTGGPGQYVFLPRGIPHAFRVVGTSPARFLVLVAPAGFEGFVTELGQPATSLTIPEPSPPDMDKLRELTAKYGIEVVGPPPD